MGKVIVLPRHKPPQLHEKAALMSFENCYRLEKIYKEVIGLNNVHHFSLNVVDSKGKMSILSYNPQIAYNIFKDGTYLYNGSISPTFYEKLDFYTWDQAYDPRYYYQLKNNMELKNGIKTGVVITKNVGQIKLLFSFATKRDPQEFISDIKENKKQYKLMGEHCFDRIHTILESYLDERDRQQIERCKSSNILYFPYER
ncbi:MAG: hypothetical protein CMF38_07945 [Legionellaceae bacterium]|nr:hypothetical protein [Legionellaceae bacterium]|tara:strand:- start:550 stop:1146 length:597 start_codon:yes stop_codon:yes gene_type:complete